MKLQAIAKKFLISVFFLTLSLHAFGQPPFDYTPTSDKHEISLSQNMVPKISNQKIEEDDVIGVFYDSAGQRYCGGYINWKDNNSAQILNANGQVPGKPGFQTGDSFYFKLWDRSRDCITDNLQVQVSPNGTYPDNAKFKKGGKTRLTELKGKNGIIQYPKKSFCQDEPDPKPTFKHLTGDVSIISPPNLAVDSNTGKIDLEKSGTGLYQLHYKTLKYQNSKVCLNKRQVNIDIKEVPDIDLGDNHKFCKGDTVFLNPGGNAAQYKWGDTIPNQQVFPAVKEGLYIVSAVSQDGCIEKDSARLEAYPSPEVNLNDTLKGCGAKTLSVEVKEPETTLEWSTGETEETIKVDKTGNYHVEKTNENGCTSSSSAFVRISPSMNIDRLDPVIQNCPVGKVHLSEAGEMIEGGTPPFHFKLAPSRGGNVKKASQLKFENLSPNEYSLKVEDSLACQKTVKNFTIQRKDCEYPIITPNCNCEDDSYFIDKQGTAKIYDKRGKLQQTLQLPAEWDGRDENGSKVPMGLYQIVVNGDDQQFISVVR